MQVGIKRLKESPQELEFKSFFPFTPGLASKDFKIAALGVMNQYSGNTRFTFKSNSF